MSCIYKYNGKDGVKIKNGNTEFTAKHGLVIPKN